MNYVDEKVKLEKDIYLKAWDTYQARVSWAGEIRWRILMAAIALCTALISFGYSKASLGIYIVSGVLAFVCLYLDSLYYRLQLFYIQRSLDTEKALREIVLEAANRHIPRGVVDTELQLAYAPSFFQLWRLRRALFWFPYAVIIIGSAAAAVLQANSIAF